VRGIRRAKADGNIPTAVGLRFTGGAQGPLPAHANNASRCIELDDDGVLEACTGCFGDHETVMTFPPEAVSAGMLFSRRC
jgi:hypothetical protein